MEHLDTIFWSVWIFKSCAYADSCFIWTMAYCHNFSVHGVSSSLSLPQQGPDGLPMPGCWQKVKWTNTEWNVWHFKRKKLHVYSVNKTKWLEKRFASVSTLWWILAPSNSFENSRINWKRYKSEKQNVPQIQKTGTSLLDFIIILVVKSLSLISTSFSQIIQALFTSWVLILSG